MRDRPLSNLENSELIDLFRQSGTNEDLIKDIAYEAVHRDRMTKQNKAAIIEQLIDLFEKQSANESDPGFPFPEIHIHDVRANNDSVMGNPDWRDVGLLKLSGYSVGKTYGIPSPKRIRILNYIFLKDDLSDIRDRSYAAEWGEAKSLLRLKKMADSISSFANQAIRNPNDTSVAVAHWTHDLAYLKKSFYDNWGGFPWPEIEQSL